MGTLLNALRRMQRDQGPTQPHASDTIDRMDGTEVGIEEPKTSLTEMNPTIQQPATIPERLHGSRAPTERPQVVPGYAGIARGAMDERVDETLSTVDALLASALASREEIDEYTPPPEQVTQPLRRVGSFSDRILEIASDGSVAPPECPTEILSQSANWQSTLDRIDEELQQCDGHDALCLFGALGQDSEVRLDVFSGDDTPQETNVISPPHAEAAGPSPAAIPPDLVAPDLADLESPTHQRVVAEPVEPEDTLVAIAAEDAAKDHEQQFHQALDYAANVVSETKHLTMDLLDSLPAYSDEAGALTHVAHHGHAAVDDEDEADSWDPAPSNIEYQHEWASPPQPANAESADLEQIIDWDDDACDEYAADPDMSGEIEHQAPITTSAVATGERPQDPATARTATFTAFEQELAIRMANVRYLEQCRNVANRMREDLAVGPGGRAVVLVGCEVDCDLSDVTAALGFIFSQSYHAKVLMVDGQFSRQPLSRHYHLSGSAGLAEACKSLDEWNHLVQPTHNENLFVLPAGCRLDRAHPTEDILRELVQRMRDRFDLVILDIGEPGSPWSDPCLAASDAAYLVVQLGRTNRSLAMGTIAALKERDRKLNGCIVMNSMN